MNTPEFRWLVQVLKNGESLHPQEKVLQIKLPDGQWVNVPTVREIVRVEDLKHG